MNGKEKSVDSSATPAERQAREFLTAGKFRKARDAYKLLCKDNRARYLPGLIEANIGLAREMLAKGQTSEAQQVMAYLKTIAAASDLAALEMEAAVRAGDFAKVAPAALTTLANPPAELGQAKKTWLADQLVVAFEPLASTVATAALAAEVAAVQAALRAVTAGQWTVAADALRPIAHTSPLSHWKHFTKGLLAFYQGERVRAARCFEAVPTDSTPGRLGAAYLILCRQAAPSALAVSEATIALLCRAIGADGLGPALARAEKQWRAGQSHQAYDTLRQSVPAFPSESPDGVGAVSDFFFQYALSGADDLADGLVNYFARQSQNRSAKTRVETKLMWRTLALHFAPTSGAVELRADWWRFLAEHEALHGKNPRLESVALAWLGQQLAASQPGHFGFSRRRTIRDRNGAEEALRKSIELWPANQAAHLALYDLYGRLRMKSDGNKLLDEMTRRFPDDKAVLLRAARSCLDRKAFKRGLQYLERVRALDMLDPSVPEMMVEGLLGQARQQMQQGKPQLGRASLERAGPLLLDSRDNLVRSRWCFLVRQGLLESELGDRERGADCLLTARAAAPSAEAALLYAHMARRAAAGGGRHVSSEQAQEFSRAMQIAADARRALMLLRIVQHWIGEDSPHRYRDDIELLNQYLRVAVKQPFTRETARELIEPLLETPLFRLLKAPVDLYIRHVLRGDAADPAFRLYQLLSSERDVLYGEGKIGKLESILAEARRRGDHATAQRAERKIADLKHAELRPPPYDAFDDDPFEDDPFEDDAAPAPGDAPSFDDSMMEGLAGIIGGMSDSEFRKFRKRAIRDMPAELFDMMADVIRKGVPLPAMPPLTPRPGTGITPKGAAPAPPPDPRQMDLF